MFSVSPVKCGISADILSASVLVIITSDPQYDKLSAFISDMTLHGLFVYAEMTNPSQ
jgi:hypothetical protein